MQEVTCPQCENIVHITPDSPLCSICGTDLDDLLSPEFAAGYFYKRATDMATSGRKQQALTEVNRGLTYSDTSDLRLLGAILANQLGDFGQMRNQVAAIPIDDALREEGEWLLRSHQAKRRAQRTSTKSGQSGSTQESVLPFPINGEGEATPAASERGNPWPLFLAIAIITVLALVWFIGLPGTRSDETNEATAQTDDAEVLAASVGDSAQNGGDLGDNGATDVSDPADAPAAQGAENVDGAADTVLVDDAPQGEAQQGDAPQDGADDASTLLPTPTSPPAEPPSPTAEPVPGAVSTDGPVNVIAYLDENGYAGLTDLAIEGELVDGVLRLAGEIPMMEDLDVVVNALSAMPDVESIDTEAVVLTPPATYIVQPGDNLWTISVRVYGDTEHMNDIFRENRDVLPSPEILTVGAEIKLPPYNPE